MGRVLLVDDEKDLAEACATSLSLAGHEMTVAYDGAEALEVLTKGAFDLVITDLRMPRLDGFTFLRWIMSHKPNTKVIVMTAFGTPVVAETAKRLGALQCLNKPVGKDRLVDAVASVLRDSRVSVVSPSITIADYVQVCMYTGKTTVFEVSSGEKQGAIGIVDGIVTHAEQGDLKGELAFFEIISWGGGEISEKKLGAPPTPNVQRGGQTLLQKALRLKDEVQPAPQPVPRSTLKEIRVPQETAVSSEHSSGPSPLQGMDQETAGGEPPHVEAAPAVAGAPSDLDALSATLNHEAQVVEYGIFVEQDFLRYKRTVTGTIPSAAPSLCLRLCDNLRGELRCGGLRYALIHAEGGARYMMFNYQNARALVGLKPGTRPEELWGKLWRR